jgi:hypothetical protein
MKKLILIFLLLLLFNCGKSKYEYVMEGIVLKVEYIKGGWGQTPTTILYFKNIAWKLYGHRSVPLKKKIYLYREKGYFVGHEIISYYKFTNKKGKYFLE